MIVRIDHIVMNCQDPAATAAWYERALGFEREIYTSPAAPGVERIALKFGPHKFNLRRTGDAGWVTCRVDAPGSLDLSFVMEGSLRPMLARLAAAGVPVTVGPAPRTGALGPMTSIYCEDPDGNLVEVSTYAADPMA
jgi:catechol 2,3-dioxygenase-like lactoylglutathione lyase family enzyme